MTSWGPKRVDLECFGVDSAMFHKYWSTNGWSDFENLGGTFIYEPAAVSLRSEQLHLFGIGMDSALWHKHWDNKNSWVPSLKGWTSLGGVCMTSPVVVQYGVDDVAAIVIGTDRAAWVCMGKGPTNFTWKSLGGRFIGDSLTACSWADGRIDVFGIGTNSELYHSCYSNGAWQATWDSRGGGCVGKPKAVAARANRLDVFVKGMDSGMWHMAWNGAWLPWQNLGGTHQYDPDVVSWDKNRLDVFSVSTDTNLTHIYADIADNTVGKFQGNWEKLGAGVTGPPKALARDVNILDVFIKGTKQQVLQKAWSANGGWVPGNSFYDLSGTITSNTA